MLEEFESFLFKFFLCLGPDGGIVRRAILDEVPDNAGEFVGHGGDGFGGAQASFPAAETVAQIVLGVPEALGGQAQGHRRSAFDVAGFDRDDFAAGDAVVRTETQPGGKGFGGGKAGDEVRPQFGEEDQGGVDLEAGHLGEVHAAEPVEFGAGIEVGFVTLRLFVLESGGGERVLVQIHFTVEAGEQQFDLLVALGDEPLVMAPGIEGLLDDEEVFGTPVALQTTSNCVAAGLDAVIFQGGELLRIAFAGQEGVEDGQAGDAGQVADDVVNLQVHLGEGFLKVLHMAAGVTDEIGAMAQERADGTNLFGRAEAGAQEADGVEVLEPLAVADVGFAAGEVLAMAGVDQTDLQAGRFEDLKQRNPIDAGGFHGHRLHSALFQPVAQGVQLIGEGAEGADRAGIGVAGHGYLNLGGPNVDAGGVGVECGQLDIGFAGGFRFDFLGSGHTVPFVERRADGPKRVKASETVS